MAVAGKNNIYLFFRMLTLSVCAKLCVSVSSPRGIPLSKLSFYNPDKAFNCFDGSAVIPFSQVNDDYCDCADSSDEPGTSACPNGTFHCINAEYRPEDIPSSRVNDGLCDCCDGTDEYSGRALCENTCKILGAALREEREKKKKLLEEGYQIYKDYSNQGKTALEQNKVKLEELIKEKEVADANTAEFEAIKLEKEKPEKDAKEKHEKAWEVVKEQRQQERDAAAAAAAFKELDVDQDGSVSIPEVQTHSEFDVDSNGEVSNVEAKEYLEDNESVNADLFAEKIWPNIKQIYKKPGAEPTSFTPAEVSPPSDEAEDNENSEDMDGDELEDEDKPRDEPIKESTTNNIDDKMPEYDEETQKLIEEADAARHKYDDSVSNAKGIAQEIDDLKKVAEIDFGPDQEFYPLKGQCFDYTDREYTYTLCPFDKAEQRSKHGGGDTSLGRWGHWSGHSGEIYSAQTYEHGLNCWNGPDRSVKVVMDCGLQNELVGASEPSRCEYEFIFHTPSLCKEAPVEEEKNPNRDEL